MNANERSLAEEITEGFKALETIRQQQAEIELHKAMIQDLEKGLESSLNLNKAQAERQVKELNEVEILELWNKKNKLNGAQGIIDFARAILKKASEK